MKGKMGEEGKKEKEKRERSRASELGKGCFLVLRRMDAPISGL